MRKKVRVINDTLCCEYCYTHFQTHKHTVYKTGLCALGHMYSNVGDLFIIGEEMLCRGVGLMDEERTDMAFRASLSTTMRLSLTAARIELYPR